MDDVVADFKTASLELLQPTVAEAAEALRSGRWSTENWNRIASTPHFFRHLPKMPQADDLMNLARKFRDELAWEVYMLTAIPTANDVPDCVQDKVEWQQEYYPDVRVRFGPFATDKKKFCKGNDILVDDRQSNIDDWRSVGGTGVHVTSDFNTALKELEELFANLKARA